MTDPASPSPDKGASTASGGLRAVLDTNVPVAAHLSRNAHSPTIELLDRWRHGEFIQLYSDDTLLELVEKLQVRKVSQDAIARYVADLLLLGEFVMVRPEQIPNVIQADPDDNAILACAFLGRASHIVTYDPHFHFLGGSYQGIPILDGLHFLYVVRGDLAPDQEAVMPSAYSD